MWWVKRRCFPSNTIKKKKKPNRIDKTLKTEKHKDETSSLLNSLLPLPANMEPGLLYRIARALLYPFVNSSWAWRQALPERSHETPLALSLRPPHTLQLEEYITSHFYHHYWRISFSVRAILSVDVFVNVRQARSSILDEFVKVRLASTTLWMSPLLCVCFMPLLESHIFCVWDWRIMENCHLCDKLLFSPIKHRKCSLRGSHTIIAVPSRTCWKSAGCIWLKFSQAIKFIQAWWTWELSKEE